MKSKTTVKVVEKTDRSIKVHVGQGKGFDVWFPDTVITADSEIWLKSNVGDEGILCVAQWYVFKKKLWRIFE